MKISSDSKIHDVLEAYPFLEDFLIRRNTHYRNLRNPLMRKTIGRLASLKQVAGMGGEDVAALVRDLADEVQRHGREGFKAFAGRKYVDPEKLRRMKDIILSLHQGEDPGELKRRFSELAGTVTPTEIADLEQSLIDEGMPEHEVRRLCDLHVAVFEESLEAGPVPETEPGHPVHTYMSENRKAEEIIAGMREMLASCGDPPDSSCLMTKSRQYNELLADLQQVSIHYTRKENQLFPLLEKHGVTGPTKVMWTIHDDIRALLKKSREEFARGNLGAVNVTLKDALPQIESMIYKEEHILFPMALEVLNEEDWQVVRHGEEAIGFAWIEPPRTGGTASPPHSIAGAAPGELELRTGRMDLEQLNLMLTHLPVDLSFVDENDRVLYYSDNPERIFPRSPAVIGRAVQNCHPSESVEMVNTILNAFRDGSRDTAEFWITLGGRFLHIRYFAVRDSHKKYRGCLEVSQDVSDIRELEGEKRLLDWQ